MIRMETVLQIDLQFLPAFDVRPVIDPLLNYTNCKLNQIELMHYTGSQWRLNSILHSYKTVENNGFFDHGAHLSSDELNDRNSLTKRAK